MIERAATCAGVNGQVAHPGGCAGRWRSLSSVAAPAVVDSQAKLRASRLSEAVNATRFHRGQPRLAFQSPCMATLYTPRDSSSRSNGARICSGSSRSNSCNSSSRL